MVKRFIKFFPKIGLLLGLLLSLGALSLYAQESTPEAVPSENPALIVETTGNPQATEAPTDAPVTTEAPLETAAPTEEGTPVVVTPSPEGDVTAEATIAPEPAFSLLVRELFDNGDVSPWLMPAGWSLIPSENGQALQLINSPAAIELQKGSFYNVAVQARFLTETGAARLSIRQSVVGQYTAVLQPTGLVELYRADNLLQSATVAASSPGQWRILRISAVDNMLRVSVDNAEVLVFEDSASLPPGIVSIGASFANAEAANIMLVDDFALWVPWDELANYPAPTPYLSPVTLEPAMATTEPSQTTSTPATPVATEQATLTPSPAATELFEGGKDYSPFPPPSAEEIARYETGSTASLGNDVFGGLTVTDLPYVASDNTVTSTMAYNEPDPTCAYIGNTVWFNFTPTATASYRLSTFGSNFDTVITVYTGSTIDNLSQLACNDDVSLTNLTSQINVTLTAGTTYYIQIGGFNGRYGDYTLTFQQLGLAAPAVPSLLGPDNALKLNNPAPTLSWSPSLNAHQYEIQWATNTTFTANLQSALVEDPTTDYTLPTLPSTAGTIYYWRVRALNASAVASAFSTVRNFTLDTVAPTAPNLLSPVVDFITTNSRQPFSWSAVTGATSYRIDIDRSSDFSNPVLQDEPVNTSSYTPPTSLSQGMYFWRVQAVDAAGNVSVESTERHFELNILKSPTSNQAIFTTAPSSNVTISWAAVPGATGYIIKLDTEPDLGNGAIYDFSVLSPAINTTLNLPVGEYYWQITPQGIAETASPVWRFVVSPPALAAPALSAPANGGRTNDTSPLFEWSDVAAPAYEIQIATNSSFTANLQMLTVYQASTDGFTLLDSAGTVYYWRIRSLNGFSVGGSFSTVRSFTLDTTAPNAPALTSPADGIISSNSRPILSWGAVTGATKYRLQISATSDFSSFNEYTPTTVSYTLPVMTQGMYYWRVQAEDAAANLSVTSAARSFTIRIATTPANNAVIFTTTSLASPLFQWVAVAGATGGYTLQIDDDTNFSDETLREVTPINVSSHTISPALGTGIYYWRVFPTGATPQDGIYSQFTISGAAIAAPALGSPANAAKTNDTTPELVWSPVDGAVSYELQWSTSATFASNVQSAIITHPTVSHILPTLPDSASTVYYWRVRSINEFNVPGAFSVARNFTLDTQLPTVPTLTSPATAAVVSTVRPTLGWLAVTGATRYLLDISVSSDFSSFVTGYENFPVTGTSHILTSTLGQGMYYWRLRAEDAAGNLSDYTFARFFTIRITTAPAHDLVIFTTLATNAPILRWAAVPGATGYILQLDDESSFAPDSMIIDTTATPLGSAITSYTAPALIHGDYYWRVIPQGVAAPVSPPISRFVISPTALAAPVVQSPANAAKTNDRTPTFSWNAVTGAAHYFIQVSTSSTFTSGATVFIVSAPATSAELPAFIELPETAGTVYYWRMSTANSLNVQGAFGAVRSFTVDTVAPSVPTLVSPADNSATATNPVSFRWNVATGAATYQIRYGTSSSPDITVSNITTTTFINASPLLATDYYWQVRAVDAAGNTSDWTTVRSFKVSSANLAAPIPNIYFTITPTLFWTPVSWTSGGGYYQVQVDNNNTFASPEFSNNNIATGNVSVTTTVLANGVWYWRVRACTAANACGAWSTTGVFSIEAE